MQTREHTHAYSEIKEIIIADAVLIFAFTFTLTGGIFSPTKYFLSSFLYDLPIVAIGVTLSFVLHELMHKFIAQRYGAIAGFKTSQNGLIITLATGLMGFLLGIPGATMIYTNNFTKKENGIVSIAGPLTNLAIFLGAFILTIILAPAQSSYIYSILSFTIFISVFLAFFNMLPIFPLDGSKVLAWNKSYYLVTMGIIFVLMITFTGIPIITIIFMIFIALMLSMFYRNII